MFGSQTEFGTIFPWLEVQGKGKLTVFRASQDIPVFARVGAVIPMDAHPQTGWSSQKCWTGILFQVTIVPSCSLKEKEITGVETRLTVNWDERKIRVGFNRWSNAASWKETAPVLPPYLWDSLYLSGQSQSGDCDGWAAIASYCKKEDRMFELLKSANLAYDRKMNYLRLVQQPRIEQLMKSLRL